MSLEYRQPISMGRSDKGKWPAEGGLFAGEQCAFVSDECSWTRPPMTVGPLLCFVGSQYPYGFVCRSPLTLDKKIDFFKPVLTRNKRNTHFQRSCQAHPQSIIILSTGNISESCRRNERNNKENKINPHKLQSRGILPVTQNIKKNLDVLNILCHDTA